jgi:autotransporter-associated beta strand protein
LSGFTGTVSFTDTSTGVNFRLNGSANNASQATFNLTGSTTGRAMFWIGGTTTVVQLGALTGNGGVLGGAGTFVSPAGTVYQIGALGTSTTFSGLISGGNSPANVALKKVGTGALTLTSSNNYGGGTTVSAGTLNAWNDSAFGSGGLSFNTSFGNSAVAQFTSANPKVTSLATTGFGTATVILGDGIGNTSTNLSLGGDNSSTTFNGTIADQPGGATGAIGSITKTGSGTFTLSGLNTYTGSTNINAGAVQLDFNQSVSPAVNILSPATTVNLAGGTSLLISGSFDGNNSQSFAGVNLSPGVASINATSGQFGSLAVHLGAITRPAGAMMSLISSGSVAMTTTSGVEGAVLADNFGVAYATLNGADWAAQDLSGNIVPATYTPSTAGSLTGNADVASGVDTTLTANAAVNSLRFNVDEARTINLGGNNLTVGGILVTNNVASNGGSKIIGGTLTAPAGGDLLISQNSSLDFTIAATIADNGGSTPLNKFGSGNLVLAGSNSFTGDTNIRGGTVTLANSAALISSTLNYASLGGSLSFGTLTSATLGGLKGTQALGLVNNLSGPVALSVGVNNLNTTFSGALSGSGSLIKVGNGILTLGGASSFSGGVTINSGSVAFTASNNLGANGGSVTFNGGALVYTASSQLGLSTNHPFSFNGDGTIIVSDPVGNLVTNTTNWSGSGTLTKRGPGTLTLGSGGSGHNGPLVVAEGILFTTSPRTPNVTAMTVMDGAQYQINDNGVNADFSFAKGAVVTLNGMGPSGSGALAYSAQSDTSASAFLSNSIVLASNSKVSVYNAATAGHVLALTLNNISGPGALIKDGPGALILTGTNTYGGTTVSNGTLAALLPAALPGYSTAGSLSVGTSSNLALPAGASGWSSTDIGALVAGNSGGFAPGSYLSLDTGSGDFTLASPLAGNLALVKVGRNTLTVTAPISYVGGTTLQMGTLQVMASGSPSLGALAINDGSLRLTGQDSTATNFTAGATTISAPVVVTTDNVSGGVTNLTMDSLSKSAGKGRMVLFNPSGTTTVNTDPGLTSGILGGWAVYGNDWATYSGNGPYALQPYSAYQTGTDSTAWAASDNVQVSTSIGPIATTTINTLKMTTGGSLSLASTATLSIATGGLLASDSATITGGNLVGSSSNNELLIAVRGVGTNLTIGSAIANTGTQSVTKTGEGTLTLAAGNGFTGGLLIAGGAVQFSSAANNLGVGNVTFDNGSTLRFTGGTLDLTTSNPFVFQGDGVIDVPTSSAVLTTNTTNWAGNGTLTKTGAGMLSLGTGGSGHSGAVVIANGILRETSQRLPNISAMTVLSGGQWQIDDDGNGANFGFPTGTVITLNGTGPNSNGAILYTPQSNLQGVAIVGNNIVLNSDTSMVVNNSSSFTYSLKLTGNISGSGGLTKDGYTGSFPSNAVSDRGILFLSGSNTYAGNTTINAGILQLGSSTALPATTVVAVSLHNTLQAALDLNGFSPTIAGLSDAVAGGVITNSAANSFATLTVTGSGSFSSLIADGGTGKIVAFAKSGTGLMSLGGANTFTGGVTVNGGTLSMNNDGALGVGRLTANGGVLDLNAHNPTVTGLRGSSGTIANSGGSNSTLIVSQSDSSTFGGTIADNGMNKVALQLASGGTLTLSGTNTYNGGTTVSNGTLILTNGGALTDGSSLTVGDASRFPPATPSPVVPSSAVPSAAAAAVPEPGTIGLVAAALLSLALLRRRIGR